MHCSQQFIGLSSYALLLIIITCMCFLLPSHKYVIAQLRICVNYYANTHTITNGKLVFCNTNVITKIPENVSLYKGYLLCNLIAEFTHKNVTVHWSIRVLLLVVLQSYDSVQACFLCNISHKPVIICSTVLYLKQASQTTIILCNGAVLAYRYRNHINVLLYKTVNPVSQLSERVVSGVLTLSVSVIMFIYEW